MLFWLKGVSICIITFFGMELFSWWIHKFLFHGPLWFIHKTHHAGHHKAFEMNDLFSLGFATASMLLIIIGFKGFSMPFWIGSGITLYGLIYFLVHDVLAHRRLAWWKKSNNTYLQAIVRAHKIHHKHMQKEDSESFGLLWVSKKYFTKRKY